MQREYLARKPSTRNRDGLRDSDVVLCKIDQSDPTKGAWRSIEYATWIQNVDDKATYWGHYFDNYEDALEDFNKRS